MGNANKMRPVIFDARQVRATRGGNMSQFRVPMKVQPVTVREETPNSLRVYHTWKGMNTCDNRQLILDSAPLGKVGDRLYVGETFRPLYINGGTGEYSGTTYGCIQYKATPGGGNDKTIRSCSGLFPVGDGRFSDLAPEGFNKMFAVAVHQMDHDWANAKWKPPIHMPRWASRMTLEITGVRAERVQGITTEDIWAEGVDNGYTNPTMGKRHVNGQQMAFEELWNSIYNNWNENPWVWVYEFKVVD